MSYAPLSLSPVEDGTSSDDFDEDAISILSNAAPHSGYTAYRPPPPSSPQPQPQQHTSERASISEKAASISSQALRLPTPPVHDPISWPSIFPSRTPSQTTRSPTLDVTKPTKSPSHGQNPPISAALHIALRPRFKSTAAWSQTSLRLRNNTSALHDTFAVHGMQASQRVFRIEALALSHSCV
jgi:hypothetical protein